MQRPQPAPILAATILALLSTCLGPVGELFAQRAKLPRGRRAADPNAPPVLNPQVMKTMRTQLVPAFFRGDRNALLETLAALLPRLNEAERKEFNLHLTTFQVPPVEQILMETRLGMVVQRASKGVKPPARGELLILIPELQKRIQETIAAARSHPGLQEALPRQRDFVDYERLFWKIHVLEQQLENARRLADFGNAQASRAKRFARRGKADERRLLRTSFAQADRQLDSLQKDLRERKLELRVQRLELAHQMLKASEDLRERLDAAFVSSQDGRLLSAFFATRKKSRERTGSLPELRRERLRDPELPETVKRLTSESAEAAGDLVEKGNLLYVGIHWWLRGRYGRGTEGGGLLKSRQALQTPNGLFPLFMPAEIYAPDKEQTTPTQPQIDRRHHYVWAFEPRRIVREEFSDNYRTKNKTATSKTTLSYFY